MLYIGQRKTNFIKRFLSLYISILILAGVFAVGFYIGGHYSAPERDKSVEGGEVVDKDELPAYLLQDVDFELFWDVWNRTKEKYLNQPVLDTQLFYGALSGIVASLGDPYSAFLDPETTKKFTDELAGSFEGIGAEIGIKKEQLVIIAPLPNTPADQAGLLAGDKIVKIEGKDTFGISLDAAVSEIRGEKGSTVILSIIRDGWDELKEVPIVRDTIDIKSVTWKDATDDIVYVRIIYFNENTAALFEEAIQKILAKNPKGIILDLRNNPGGFLEVGVRVASEWIASSGTVVIQEFQGGVRQEFIAEGQARLHSIPTVVLVNPGSASASEIVAGALQDYKAATILGQTTFGKGSVQTFEQLRGGAALKLTVAHWLTPNGRQIDEQGIIPDFEIELDQDDYDNSRDPQLDKAIELLQ